MRGSKTKRAGATRKDLSFYPGEVFYENAAECPVLWTGMNAAVFEFDRQDILVLHSIFAGAGKPRLSVKPRLVGGELHC